MEIPRTVLVTGASSGVGRSLATHLAASFDHVIVAARRIERLRDDFDDENRFTPYQVDLADPKETDAFVGRVRTDHGFVPYVINGAGVASPGRLDEIDLKVLERSVEVNAYAPMRILRALMPVMRMNNFGRVINVTSGAPLNCFPGVGSYSGSKALLNALTVTLAHEFVEFDIKINLMSPGPVRSEMAPEAPLEPEACHPTADYLLNLPSDGPTGRFYWLGYEVPLFPNLEGVGWLSGVGNERLTRVL